MPYSQRYLFNAIPDTNYNANPTNPNRNSKGNPNPTLWSAPITLTLEHQCVSIDSELKAVLGKLLFKSNLSMSTITWLEK